MSRIAIFVLSVYVVNQVGNTWPSENWGVDTLFLRAEEDLSGTNAPQGPISVNLIEEFYLIVRFLRFI